MSDWVQERWVFKNMYAGHTYLVFPGLQSVAVVQRRWILLRVLLGPSDLQNTHLNYLVGLLNPSAQTPLHHHVFYYCFLILTQLSDRDFFQMLLMLYAFRPEEVSLNNQSNAGGTGKYARLYTNCSHCHSIPFILQFYWSERDYWVPPGGGAGYFL